MIKTQNVNEKSSLKIKHEFFCVIQTVHTIQARRPDLVLINKKKRTCHPGDFVVPADQRTKVKEI